MSLSEDRCRPRDRVMRSPGTGHLTQRLCWFCNKPRNQDGGRYVGPLRLWGCAGCKPKKTEAPNA